MFSAFFLAWKNLPRGRGGVGGDQKNEILSITSYYIFAVKAWKARKPWNIEQDKKTVFVASVLSSLIFFLAQQTSNIQEKGFAPRSPVSNYTISVKKSPPQIVALVKNSEGGAWRNTWWRGKYASINIVIPFWKRHIFTIEISDIREGVIVRHWHLTEGSLRIPEWMKNIWTILKPRGFCD